MGCLQKFSASLKKSTNSNSRNLMQCIKYGIKLYGASSKSMKMLYILKQVQQEGMSIGILLGKTARDGVSATKVCWNGPDHRYPLPLLKRPCLLCDQPLHPQMQLKFYLRKFKLLRSKLLWPSTR
jgi:hypothetical protein